LQEARRQAAAEAANRRLQQSESRGVDEDELRRMKQRQIDRERLEEQQKKLSTQTGNNSGGLRVSELNYFFFILIFRYFFLVANELIFFSQTYALCVIDIFSFFCDLEMNLSDALIYF
jgi:Flp pilus assembly protein TadB